MKESEPARLAAIRGRLDDPGLSPAPWFVNARTGVVCHGDPDDDRENYPIDNPEDDEFAAHSRQDVPWLCDRLLEAWGVIADVQQDDGYRWGVAEGLRMATEVAKREASRLWNYSNADSRVARGVAEKIVALGPAVPPLPPDGLLREYERMREALQRITNLPHASGPHGPAPGLQACQNIASDALGKQP